MSPSGFSRIIPARLAEMKEVESFPYFAATFTAPLAVEDGSFEGDQSLSSEINSPEEDAKRLASVDQIIFDKLQQAEREAHDIARRAYEEGFAAGETEGRTFGESQYRSYMQRLDAHFQELSQSATLLDLATEEEIIALALTFGEYLAGQQIDQAQQAIRPLLESILESHPFNASNSSDNAALVIFLNAKDLEQLGDTYVAHPGIALREDLELSRGSLRIEAAEGVLEATLERRRERLLEAIHRSREKGRGLMDLELLKQRVRQLPSGDILGRVSKVVGLIVESRGPEASLGEQMLIHMGEGRSITAEVVGFQGQQVLLMPIENADGIRPGLLVEAMGHQPQLPLSEALLGRVIDPLGRPLDDGPPIQAEMYLPIHGQPPNPMHRRRIGEVLATGIRAIDGMLTLGKGQRIGVFSGSGVGKSTILGMIARYTSAQVNVIVLVGERGRELREFLENDLGEEGLKRSVVVVATSDQTPLLRLRCALSGTTVAEYFMRKGKDVLMMMDSVTRFAMAQREVGLSAGEPPSSRGYTPSVFTLLPRLMERAGTFEGFGSITGIYTVLVEGDDMNEPISDAVRGILDGHVVLARKLATKNHFPAVDVLASISRLFSTLAIPEQKQLVAKIRDLMATYNDAEDLIQIGAYTKGSSNAIDQAIQFQPAIQAFLRQAVAEGSTHQQTLLAMGQVFGVDLAPYLKSAV